MTGPSVFAWLEGRGWVFEHWSARWVRDELRMSEEFIEHLWCGHGVDVLKRVVEIYETTGKDTWTADEVSALAHTIAPASARA